MAFKLFDDVTGGELDQSQPYNQIVVAILNQEGNDVIEAQSYYIKNLTRDGVLSMLRRFVDYHILGS